MFARFRLQSLFDGKLAKGLGAKVLLLEVVEHPEKFSGQGYVGASSAFACKPLCAESVPRYVVSQQSSENAELTAMLITDSSVSLHTTPIAFMDTQERVDDLAERTGHDPTDARTIVGHTPDPDFVLRLGSNVQLVFKGKGELLEFLDQCVEIREKIE